MPIIRDPGGANTDITSIIATTDDIDAMAADKTPTVGTGLGTTGTVDLDMAALNDTYQTISLTGDITFTTSNRAAGRSVTVKLIAGGSTRTLAWPSWTPLSTALPTSLETGKVAMFTVTFFDTTDAAAVVSYAAQDALNSGIWVGPTAPDPAEYPYWVDTS